jgi:ABC-type enterobactin transport system permease subunit
VHPFQGPATRGFLAAVISIIIGNVFLYYFSYGYGYVGFYIILIIGVTIGSVVWFATRKRVSV